MTDRRRFNPIHPLLLAYASRMSSFKKLVSRSTIDREAALQTRAHALGLAPRVVGIERREDTSANPQDTLVMDVVDGENLFSQYGDDASAVPADVWARVVQAMRLLRKAGIDFVDCTSFNFMIDSAGDFYVIDFGDAVDLLAGARLLASWMPF